MCLRIKIIIRLAIADISHLQVSLKAALSALTVSAIGSNFDSSVALEDVDLVEGKKLKQIGSCKFQL